MVSKLPKMSFFIGDKKFTMHGSDLAQEVIIRKRYDTLFNSDTKTLYFCRYRIQVCPYAYQFSYLIIYHRKNRRFGSSA